MQLNSGTCLPSAFLHLKPEQWRFSLTLAFEKESYPFIIAFPLTSDALATIPVCITPNPTGSTVRN